MVVNIMRVVMLKPTRWNGESLFPDQEVEVDEKTGHRWLKNEIASVAVESTDADAANDKEKDNPEGGSNNPYEGLKAKELYDLCKAKGLDVEIKQPEEYYTEKLKAAEAAEETQ